MAEPIDRPIDRDFVSLDRLQYTDKRIKAGEGQQDRINVTGK